MSTIWFNVADTEPSNSQSIKAPFLGIFTEEPSNIAASLSRPITPFQNTNSQNFISHYDAFLSYNKNSNINYVPEASFAESPPRNVSLSIDGKKKRMFELNVYP